MTTLDIRNRIAEMEGWLFSPYGKGHIWYPEGWPDCNVPIRSGGDHPIPDTLDEAAKLPEGWLFEVSSGNWWTDMSGEEKHVNALMFTAHATRASVNYDDDDGDVVFAGGTFRTELEARFALRLAVLEHIAKERPTP